MCPKTQIERDRIKIVSYTMDIRSIIYLMLCIRPYVSYALSITKRYQSNPNESLWNIVKNTLKYLKRIKNVFLAYRGDELVVHSYLVVSFQ